MRINNCKRIKVMRIICVTCGEELEFTTKDIKEDNSGNSFKKDYYYECPFCQQKNYLDYDEY